MGILYLHQDLDEWNGFVQDLQSRNRFIPSSEAYVASLVQDCLEMRKWIAPGTSLFRSRIMPLARSMEATPLPPEEMGPPPTQMATSGRLNPDGIQCLYAALEEDTAVAEVRPWAGARLTVAEFRTKDGLEVLDMTRSDRSSATKFNYRQRLLSLLIARPVHREDRWGYLGTQYLAEALKAKGVIGLLYGSSLRANGSNVAMFSTMTFVEATTKLVDVYSVSYSYGPPPSMR